MLFIHSRVVDFFLQDTKPLEVGENGTHLRLFGPNHDPRTRLGKEGGSWRGFGVLQLPLFFIGDVILGVQVVPI